MFSQSSYYYCPSERISLAVRWMNHEYCFSIGTRCLTKTLQAFACIGENLIRGAPKLYTKFSQLACIWKLLSRKEYFVTVWRTTQQAENLLKYGETLFVFCILSAFLLFQKRISLYRQWLLESYASLIFDSWSRFLQRSAKRVNNQEPGTLVTKSLMIFQYDCITK